MEQRISGFAGMIGEIDLLIMENTKSGNFLNLNRNTMKCQNARKIKIKEESQLKDQ